MMRGQAAIRVGDRRAGAGCRRPSQILQQREAWILERRADDSAAIRLAIVRIAAFHEGTDIKEVLPQLGHSSSLEERLARHAQSCGNLGIDRPDEVGSERICHHPFRIAHGDRQPETFCRETGEIGQHT